MMFPRSLKRFEALFRAARIYEAIVQQGHSNFVNGALFQ
jgi:hypothetical protein